MREYLLGNVAIARGILEAGAGLAAGYPGTPSSEIIDTLSGIASRYDIHVEWSVNEKAALEVAIGGSWAGTRSVATMKHVGLNVAADPFMTLAYLGVDAGLVIVSADDPYCHSSQNEQDTRRYAQFASVPCLDPADPQEAKDMTIYAFELSERFGVPVLLRPTTRVSHARSDVETGEIPEGRRRGRGFRKDPARRVSLPVNARRLHRELIDKQKDMEREIESAPWNRLALKGDVGVISSGIGGLYAEEALANLGADLSLLRIGTYPVPSRQIEEIVKHTSKVMVIEEMEPVVEEQVEIVARRCNPELQILGKKSGDVPRAGELDLLTVRNAIARMLGMSAIVPKDLPGTEIVPPRPPSLCPGCGHRAAYYAMRKAFGKDAIYTNDIGCYTIGISMGTVDTCLCMGASITIGSGIRFGGDERPICCCIGDSTFLHAGMTGLLNAAYNKSRMTIAILDNSTTAMTGHQPHPGTGVTATGEETVHISLEEIVKALGAGHVECIDPYSLEESISAFARARDFPGLSVVISRAPCRILLRRKGERFRRYRVTDVCVGCRQCLEFDCPAIEFDEKASINQLCTGCGVCAQICPKGAIEVMR